MVDLVSVSTDDLMLESAARDLADLDDLLANLSFSPSSKQAACHGNGCVADVETFLSQIAASTDAVSPQSSPPSPQLYSPLRGVCPERKLSAHRIGAGGFRDQPCSQLTSPQECGRCVSHYT